MIVAVRRTRTPWIRCATTSAGMITEARRGDPASGDPSTSPGASRR
jgi:hypothetical protein